MYTDGLIERPGQNRLWSNNLGTLLNASEFLKKATIKEAVDSLSREICRDIDELDDDIVLIGIEV